MPQIPEETIDLVLDRVNDTLEAVRIQNQAMTMLSDHMADVGKVLVAIHDAVTAELGGSELVNLLTEISTTTKGNAHMLRQLLTKA